MKYVIAILILFSSFSCSDAHKAQQGYKKFIKYGGKINSDTTTVTLSDTIKINGKDSIIYRTFNTICPDPVFPPTRYEVKYRYKTVHDSMNVVKWKIKYVYKEKKSDNRKEKKGGFWYNLRFIGVILGLLVLIILLFKWK